MDHAPFNSMLDQPCHHIYKLVIFVFLRFHCSTGIICVYFHAPMGAVVDSDVQTQDNDQYHVFKRLLPWIRDLYPPIII